MFSSPFLRRLFLPHLLVVCLAIAGMGLFTAVRVRSTYIQSRTNALREDTDLSIALVRETFATGGAPRVSELVARLGNHNGARVTVIDHNGHVIADSWADAGHMGDHALRPEVRSAVKDGEGTDIRISQTTGEELLYLARRFPGPGNEPYIFRLAVPVPPLRNQAGGLLLATALAATLAMAASGLICYRFARSQAAPVLQLKHVADDMAQGRLDSRSELRGEGELVKLGQSLNHLAESTRDLVVSAGRESSELKTILSTIGEGIIATDAQQRIVLANSAAGGLLDFDPADAHGKPLWQVVRIEEIIRAARDALQTGERGTFELALVGGRHLEINVHPLLAGARSSDGSAARADIDGLVLVAHDTTQSVRYQELRKEFVANVSHELRTPLTVIKGFIETLRDGAMNEPAIAKDYLAKIDRHTNQLTNLVEDLLELSRLESQPDLPRRVSIDLASVIRKAVDLLTPAAQGKRMTLSMEVGHLPLMLGNPDYLERAVANLIDNAVKYTPVGGRVTVVARPDDGGIVVEVSDNGIGIPADELPRIFERFYRVDRSRSREMGGTGLGLSIVKHIVQAHGGTVEAESVPGKGSTFRLRFTTPHTSDLAVSADY